MLPTGAVLVERRRGQPVRVRAAARRDRSKPRSPTNLSRTTLGSTDREIQATLAELLGALDADAEYEVRHEDFVADMPQSGERIRGREAMRELQLAFPPEAKPTFTVRRITGSG